MALPGTNPTYQYLDSTQADGTVLGRTSAGLIAFFGATPVAQPAGTTAAVATTVASSTQVVYSLTSAQSAAIIALVNELRANMVTLGLKAS